MYRVRQLLKPALRCLAAGVVEWYAAADHPAVAPHRQRPVISQPPVILQRVVILLATATRLYQLSAYVLCPPEV